MANFYSNLNLKRNQLLLPVIHPAGQIPDGTNVQGQLYYRNDSGNEQLFLCTAAGDDGTWVPLYNNISALTNGGLTVANDGQGQDLQTISLGLTNLINITNNGQALEDADVMAVHDVTGGVDAARKVTMTLLKAYTNSGIVSNVAGNLGETPAADSYTITTSNGSDLSMSAADSTNWGIMTDDHVAAIGLNTNKLTNVTTDLSITGTSGARTIVSSDGTDAVIPVATTAVSGVMSTGIFDAVAANTNKLTNVTTDLSITGTTGARTIVSSDGTDAVIPVATTSASGLLSPTLFDTIASNSSITGNVTTDLTLTGTTGALTVVSSDGTDAVIPVATTSASGLMTPTMFDDNALISTKANKASPAFTGDSTHIDASPSYVMTDTSNDTSGGIFRFVKAPADETSNDNDSIGMFSWLGYNDESTPEAHEYGTLQVVSTSTAEDAERSDMRFAVKAGGTLTQGLNISGTSTDGRVSVTLGADSASTTTIVGNLVVSGSTTTVNTETINLADNIIILNSNLADDTAPTQQAGWEVYRGTGTGSENNAKIIFDETSGNVWKMDQGDGNGLVAIGSSADTMGSGFTVTATSGSSDSTITENDTLTLTAGSGISTTATSDGVITIANTSPNVVEADMGAGFTVTATSGSSDSTITVGDTLTLTAGSGVSTTATSDGVITIANTSPNVVEADMGAGFTVTATSGSSDSTITVGDTLTLTAGSGVSTTATSDGVITIANTSPNVVEADMGAGFTVTATSGSSDSTITVGDTLTLTAGSGISTTATSDGVITIANTAQDTGNTQLPAKVAIIVVASIDTTLKTVNITHGLGAGDIMVQLYELNNDAGIISNLIFADVQRTDDATIQVKFDKIPSNNVRAVMIAENGTDLTLDSGSYPS